MALLLNLVNYACPTAVPQIFIEAEAAFAEAHLKAQVAHLATTAEGRGVQTS